MFYLCGRPTEFSSYRGGSIDWHSGAAGFVGSGVTEQGVCFSYHADWVVPGRWGIEIMSRKRRFILRPLERLSIMKLASTEIEMMNLESGLDEKYKSGLYL